MLQPTNTPLSLSNGSFLLKAKYWTPQLEPQSATAIMPKTLCLDSDIPVTYIQCSKDPQAKAMGAMLPGGKWENWTIKTIDADDDPFVSHVEELGEIIVKVGKIGRGGGMG